MGNNVAADTTSTNGSGLGAFVAKNAISIIMLIVSLTGSWTFVQLKLQGLEYERLENLRRIVILEDEQKSAPTLREWQQTQESLKEMNRQLSEILRSSKR